MINRNLIKQFRQNCRAATIVHPLSRRNFANSDTWAAKELAAKGESITPVVGKKFIAINRSSVSHPSDKIKALAEEILHLNALETTALWKNIQSRLGVTDEEFMGAMPGGGGRGSSSAVKETVQEAVAAPEPVKEKEIFDIKIGAVDAAVKLKVIKEVRTITGLGLKEAKELVEKAPIVIKKGLKKEEIDAVKKVLLAVGATVEVL